jgi:hypothetical protein
LKQFEQQSERLRKERDRLKAQLSAQENATKSASGVSGTSSGLLPSVRDSAGLQVSFDKLAAQLGGSEGLALTVAGVRATTQLGSWKTGPSWSTVKVPLAMAAVANAHGRPDAEDQRLMRLAITASDNAVAEHLWSGLGEPAHCGGPLAGRSPIRWRW